MRNMLLTTAAVTALTLGASVAMAQTQSPGASETAPGAKKPPVTSTESSGKPERKPGQDEHRPSASSEAPGKSETAPGQHQRQNASNPASSHGTSAEKAPEHGKRPPATTGSTGGSQNATQSSESQKPAPQGNTSHSATGAQDGAKTGAGATSKSTSESQPAQKQGTSQSATGSGQQQNTSGSQQGSTTSQSSTAQQGGASASGGAVANLNTEQRSEVTRAFTSTNVNTASNVNFNVSVGSTITHDVRLAPVPAEVVRILPQYRNYEYVVVRDEIVIVEPKTKKVVEVINKSGAPRKSASINLSSEQRRKFKTTVETTGSTRTNATHIELRQGEVLPEDVSLMDVPQTIITEVPELRTYRYVVIGDEIGIVEPDTRRVIEVIQ